MKCWLVVCVLAVLVCHATVSSEFEEDGEAYAAAGPRKKYCKTCKTKGACQAMNYKGCCKTTALQSCLGKPATCYCDTSCHILKDCCADAHKIGCKKAPKKKAPTPTTVVTPSPTKALVGTLKPASSVPSTPSQNTTTTPAARLNPVPTTSQVPIPGQTTEAATNPQPTPQNGQPSLQQPQQSTTSTRDTQTDTALTQSSTAYTPQETNTDRSVRGGLVIGGVKMKQHHFIMIIVVTVILIGILLILVCQSVQCAVLCRNKTRSQKQHLLRKGTIPSKEPPPAPGKGQFYSTLPEVESEEENIYSEP